MPARSLTIVAAIACLAIPLLVGSDVADARQRGAAKSQPQVTLPPTGSIQVPATAAAPTTPSSKSTEPVRPLTCRQYVAAAGTIIAVACPDALPSRRSNDDGDAAGAGQDAKPQPRRPASNQPTRTAVGARGCRHFLASIGRTIAVDCEDTAEPVSDAAAAPSGPAPAPPPPAVPHVPIAKRPVIMADNAMTPDRQRHAGRESEGERDRRCDAALARASLGTVASGNLAELRRGC